MRIDQFLSKERINPKFPAATHVIRGTNQASRNTSRKSFSSLDTLHSLKQKLCQEPLCTFFLGHGRQSRKEKVSISGLEMYTVLGYFHMTFTFFKPNVMFKEFLKNPYFSHQPLPLYNLESIYVQILDLHVGQLSDMAKCDTNWNELTAIFSC